MDERQVRSDLAEIGKLLYDRDLLTAKDGNLSVLLSPGRILTTPAGACKGRLTPKDFVLVNERGEPFGDGAKPSTELKMHLAVYRMRPDVRAVVHSHPPHATAFAVAGVPIDQAALAEVIYNIGVIPLTDYALPSTNRLAGIIGHYIAHYQALLLRNHGVLTVGSDLWEAYYRMESVEHFARILIYASQLGGAKSLGPRQVAELCELRRNAGEVGPHPICSPASNQPVSNPKISEPSNVSTAPQENSELVQHIAQIVAQELTRSSQHAAR